MTPKLKIIPLGGLGEIGKNMTVIEFGNDLIIIDCGMGFPDENMYGIDVVLPDITYLRNNASRIRGMIITHGHEDHIGALPYILRELPVPVYGTKLTLAIIRNKLEEYKMADEVSLNVVSYGDVVTCDDISVEFIRTNHSVADAAALAIRCEAGTIIHTGDFKVDFTPVYGEPIDLQRLGEIGKQGVLALMCDSTNALKPGHTMSERSVGKTFDNIFAENTNRRIIVATFASNVDRVQQIINSAQKYGRKVAIEGRSMVNIVTTAQELGYIRIPEGLLIPIEEVKNYPDNQLALIMTGSQGEPMAALSRIASNTHKRVSIMPGDVVIISSTPIPGNEKAVSKLINVLSMLGANVIFQDTHVSGHANQDEIKLLYCLLKPKYSIPIHGEYRHRIAQKHIAEGLGMASDHVIILKSGDMLDIGYDGASLAGSVPAHGIMVDGLGIGDVGNAVLRDRQYLSVNGIVIVSVAIDPEIGEIISGPDIVTRGFVYVKESERLLEEAREVVLETCNRFTDFERLDTNRLRAEIKSVLGDFFWKSMKRSPMILPVILELDA